MKCPNCEVEDLVVYKINDVNIHTCHKCHGLWFGKDEFEKLKDEIPMDAWFDLDIWDDKEKTLAKPTSKACPVCSIPLLSLDWDNSHVVIDICKKCGSVWLEYNDFNKVMEYIEEEADIDILYKYRETLKKKTEEVFDGPKHLKDRMHDVLTFMNMYQYKFLVQDPEIAKMLINIPVGL